MVRVQAANEHYLKSIKHKRKGSVEEIYKPIEKFKAPNGVAVKSKMGVSKSQPDLKFQDKNNSPRHSAEDYEQMSEYSDEVK